MPGHGHHGHHGHGGQLTPEQQRQMIEQDLRLAKNLGKIKHKIVVMSGKGGVGKSTVAANIAETLHSLGFKTGILDNKYLIGSFFAGAFLQTIVVIIPYLSNIFELVPLNKIQWIYTILLSFLPIIIIEMQKMINKIRFQKPSYYNNQNKWVSENK